MHLRPLRTQLAISAIASVLVALVACTGGGDGTSDGGASSSGTTTSSSTTSSGGGTSGGGSSTTSSGGSSGFITDGGPGGCGGPVNFELTVKGDAAFCTGQGSCNAEWLTVQRADKTSVIIETSCSASCGACEQVGCTDNCPQPNPVPKTGATKTWRDGRIFTSMTCSSKSNGGGAIQCAEPSCAAPGKYIAHMCAFRAADAGAGAGPLGGCNIGGATPTQICTDVEFDFPTTATVKGIVGP